MFLTDEKIINSMTTVLPFSVVRNHEHEEKEGLNCLTVTISFIGEVNQKVTIKGEERIFGELGKTMYGMELEGMMLESFASELWNMILGGIMVSATEQGVDVDITPATLNGELHDTEAIYHLDVFQGEKIGVLTVFVSP